MQWKGEMVELERLVSMLDELLNAAKADITWKVTWTVETNGIQTWVSYGIDALDSYTNEINWCCQ